MFRVKACTVCFKTDVKVFDLNERCLRDKYNLVSGLVTYSQNGLLEYLCYQCVAYIKSFEKFRDKCQLAYYALREVFQRDNEITKSVVEDLCSNLTNMGPSISCMSSENLRIKYECIESVGNKQEHERFTDHVDIPTIQYSTETEELVFETKVWVNLEDDEEQNVNDIKNHEKITNKIVDCDIQTKAGSGKITKNGQGVSTDSISEDFATLEPILRAEEVDSSIKNKNGVFLCNICQLYYPTKLLCISHMEEKHIYKYYCRRCPVVNLDRILAKRHYYEEHMTEISQELEVARKRGSETSLKLTKHSDSSINSNLTVPAAQSLPSTRPAIQSLPSSKATIETLPSSKALIQSPSPSKPEIHSGISPNLAIQSNLLGQPVKALFSPKPTIQLLSSTKQEEKVKDKFLDDFRITLNTQDEQYAIVTGRQKKKNYKESLFKCEHCFKGFRTTKSFVLHLMKHYPVTSDQFQCDICKKHYQNKSKMKNHMINHHLYKYSCQKCSYVGYNKNSAKSHHCEGHIQPSHKDVGTATESNLAFKPRQPNESYIIFAVQPNAAIPTPIYLQPVPVLQQLSKHAAPLKSSIQSSRPLAQNTNSDDIRVTVKSIEAQYATIRDRRKTTKYTESPFKCEYCFMGFKSIASYAFHLKRHDPKISGQLQCDICKEHCPNTSKMKYHMIKRHMYKYSCQKCNYVGYNKNKVKRHTAEHKEISQETKPIVSNPPLNQQYIVQPYPFITLPLQPLITELLSKSKHTLQSPKFPSIPSDALEINSNFKIKVNSPREQYKLIRNRQKTKAYIKSPFKCGHCFEGFKEAYSLTDHLKEHDPKVSGRLRCDVCKKYFHRVSDVRAHMRACHIYTYRCNQCKYVGCNKKAAREHLKSHKDDGFQCPHCKKEFRGRWALRHICRLRHPTLSICNICGHKFVNEYGLRLHMKMAHGVDTPATCTVETPT